MKSDDAFQNSRYLVEFKKFPRLSREDEAHLAQKIHAGDSDALQRLVESNLQFVVLVSRKYISSGLPLSDLVNEGTIGLIEAAKRFNPERGVKFITYAVWWIRQAILYAIAEKSGIIRLPPKQVSLVYLINKKIQILTQKLSRTPSLEEVSSEVNLPISEIESLLTITQSVLSLEPASDDEDENGYTISVADQNAIPVDDRVIEDNFADEVDLLLACLDEREKAIMKLHYGLDGTSLTLQQIGDRFCLTRERIRQIEQRAIKKLKRLALKRNLHDFLG